MTIGLFPRLLGLLAVVLLAAACRTAGPPDPTNPLATIGGREILRIQPTTQRINDVSVLTLPSGMTLIHRQTTANDIVGMVLYVRQGMVDDPDAQAGATQLLMRTIVKGTERRTADDIAEEAGMLGTSIAPSAGYDFSSLSLQCINRDLEAAMDLFADIVKNPVFPQEELALERERLLAAIRMTEDQTHALAGREFRRALFGTHPYGRPSEGTPESLAAINRADLGNIHRDHFVPSNMVLSVVGNVPLERIQSLVEQHFGEPALEPEPRIDRDKIITPAARRVPVFKESQQVFIVLGHLTCPQGHGDEPAVKVADAILGSGMSSRLFRELRDKQGLAYAVGSSSSHYQDKGAFMAFIGTSPDKARQAEEGLWREVEKLRETPVPEDELQRAKNAIAGAYLRGHERNMGQARYLGFWHLTGRGVAYDDTYLEAIEAVTPRDVMRVANKYFLDPTTVLVGPERLFEDQRTRQEELEERLEN